MGGIKEVWEQGIENNFLPRMENKEENFLRWENVKLAVNAVQQLQGLAAVA